MTHTTEDPMHTCDHCERPVRESCTVTHVRLHGHADPVARERCACDAGPYPTSSCGDCGVARGDVHHPGCDMERCPGCGGQLLACGCLAEYVAPLHAA